jgi:tRNA(Ile)-lysidine synthetase-like protein
MIKFSKEIMELALSRMPKCSSVNILCSMGVDSVAASHFYGKMIKEKYHKFWGVRHFNHKQRPQNNAMELAFQHFSLKYDTIDSDRIPCFSSADLQQLVENTSEDGLRQARLKFIQLFLQKTIIITAHHLDDATESYMLNVLRGKEGFLPIPFITEVGSNLIVHPFLFTKKKDFREYAEKNDLMKYVVEDETNKVTKGSRRNFIRNEIMPLIQREKMGLDTIVKKKMNERLMLEIIKG